MGIYFKPLRRKLGVLTLVVACVLMAGWIRSNTICDSVAFNFFGNKYTVRSYRQQFLWDREYVNYGRLDDPFFTCFSVNIAKLSVSDAHPMFGFTEENRKLASNFVPTPRPSVRLSLVISQLPYWSIVIPLTVLSAWLLLSKPRMGDNRSLQSEFQWASFSISC